MRRITSNDLEQIQSADRKLNKKFASAIAQKTESGFRKKASIFFDYFMDKRRPTFYKLLKRKGLIVEKE